MMILPLVLAAASFASAAAPRMMYQGYNPRRLVLADETGVEISSVAGSYLHNQWSPDGSRFLFTAKQDPGSPSAIIVMDTKLKYTMPKGLDPETYFHTPTWSADGKSIILNESFQVTRVGVDEKTSKVLCPENKDLHVGEVHPSPDGKLFAAFAYPGDPQESFQDVYVMNPDCTSPRRLTTDRGHPSGLRWSPDGKRLAWTLDGKIIVIDATGQNRKEFKEGEHSSASWTDDGRLLTEWSDPWVGQDRTSYLGFIDPATGLAAVLRKGVNLGIGFPEWRPRKKAADSHSRPK
ncbi:MAG: hypothetical protein PHS14_04365 [Elusimicrobia bacterium]|nr:hypothetical protein [Elusimicrobiota bacterium]